ncbi:MAG: hypothetical protein JWO15_3562 [Sphingomonadales bacterium]|nr:hypothetical protein [Sphingomonadales bacterium]
MTWRQVRHMKDNWNMLADQLLWEESMGYHG